LVPRFEIVDLRCEIDIVLRVSRDHASPCRCEVDSDALSSLAIDLRHDDFQFDLLFARNAEIVDNLTVLSVIPALCEKTLVRPAC
jgi:hypothetical protein